MENKNFYNEILTDHNIRPQYKHELDNATIEKQGVNPSCGDDITLKLIIKDDIITDGAFSGSGCAISQASTDIMLNLIIGKTTEQVKLVIDIFLKMIKGTATDDEIESLEEAQALKDISHLPSRVKCAVLAWHTLEECINDSKN